MWRRTPALARGRSSATASSLSRWPIACPWKRDTGRPNRAVGCANVGGAKVSPGSSPSHGLGRACETQHLRQSASPHLRKASGNTRELLRARTKMRATTDAVATQYRHPKYAGERREIRRKTKSDLSRWREADPPQNDNASFAQATADCVCVKVWERRPVALYVVDLTVATLCGVVCIGSLDGHADDPKAASQGNPATIITSVPPEPPLIMDFRRSAGGPNSFDSVRAWQMHADRNCKVVGQPPQYDCVGKAKPGDTPR